MLSTNRALIGCGCIPALRRVPGIQQVLSKNLLNGQVTTGCVTSDCLLPSPPAPQLRAQPSLGNVSIQWVGRAGSPASESSGQNPAHAYMSSVAWAKLLSYWASWNNPGGKSLFLGLALPGTWSDTQPWSRRAGASSDSHLLTKVSKASGRTGHDTQTVSFQNKLTSYTSCGLFYVKTLPRGVCWLRWLPASGPMLMTWRTFSLSVSLLCPRSSDASVHTGCSQQRDKPDVCRHSQSPREQPGNGKWAPGHFTQPLALSEVGGD